MTEVQHQMGGALRKNHGVAITQHTLASAQRYGSEIAAGGHVPEHDAKSLPLARPQQRAELKPGDVSLRRQRLGVISSASARAIIQNHHVNEVQLSSHGPGELEGIGIAQPH